MFLMIIKVLIVFILILFSMGFYLLIERKLMSFIHFRFGPNKVFFIGLLQFLLDLIKLLIKEHFYIYFFYFVVYINLFFLLLISFLLWIFINFNYINVSNYNYFIIIIVFMLLKLIFLLMFLFFLKSFYVQVSLVRVIIQFVSYDILIVLMLIIIMFLISGFDLKFIFFIQNYVNLINMSLYLFFFWVLSMLMEILRLPFDFYEGESELVSGFNLELGSFNFIVLFIVEYLDMIYFVNLTCLVYFCFHYIELIIMLIYILWFRTVFMRYRFDKMLDLMWKKVFFIVMIIIVFIFLVSNF